MQETQVQSQGQENPLEKGMATHFSILLWRTSWTQEPGRLQSMGKQRVGHDWVTNTVTYKYPQGHICVHASARAHTHTKSPSTCLAEHWLLHNHPHTDQHLNSIQRSVLRNIRILDMALQGSFVRKLYNYWLELKRHIFDTSSCCWRTVGCWISQIISLTHSLFPCKWWEGTGVANIYCQASMLSHPLPVSQASCGQAGQLTNSGQ